MLQKDKALQDIEDSFKEYCDLMMKQLSELENITQKGDNNISDGEIKNIKTTEKKLNKFEVKISEQIISTIVLHQPVASELRRLMACYRIVINMERIGDLIENVIYYIRKIEDSKLYEELSDVIYNMVTSSTSMVEKSLLSFINDDRDSAIWTIKNDEILDEMNKKLMKKGIKKTKLQNEARDILLNLINFKTVISKIERIGDHAGHIAEASIFAQEGKDIRHQKLNED
ncbi:phosphate signaling complex PhoU family protein [Plebeiibacterium sediminum]|uniref:PhoU domain-containing protein n=1 Tax=Plebeiibacterium sediminum TaxID=2992112 RepID=A0AAE3SGP0_9BACT|nr:PhoU domain-containing protein [Plebeiobacterium sediminum]MCW3788536.1 hypothetical protein [Plebeiobacterium sediminum]